MIKQFHNENKIIEIINLQPQLPGCMADRETYEDALKNIQLVIDEWIETAKSLGKEIPKPKGKLMYA